MKLAITTERFTIPSKIIIPKPKLVDRAKAFIKKNKQKKVNAK